MNDFHEVLRLINDNVYKKIGLHVENVQEERHNAKYGAGTFTLSSTTVRFRVANVTPKKDGQFVAFWEKDDRGNNRPYAYEEAPDVLIITTFQKDGTYGQFIFPKDVLLERNIVRSSSTKGKMAMRVYPSWDQPRRPQAIRTQQWQLRYFIPYTDTHLFSLTKDDLFLTPMTAVLDSIKQSPDRIGKYR